MATEPYGTPPVLYTTTRWMRSSSVRPDSEPCIERRCRETGDGTHIFCYTNDPEVEGSLLEGAPEHLSDAKYWLHRALAQFPEGTRVRITVEAEPARRAVFADASDRTTGGERDGD